MTDNAERERASEEDGGVEKHQFVFSRCLWFYIIAVVVSLELSI